MIVNIRYDSYLRKIIIDRSQLELGPLRLDKTAIFMQMLHYLSSEATAAGPDVVVLRNKILPLVSFRGFSVISYRSL